MEIRHNGELIATIGDLFTKSQIKDFLKANNVSISFSQLTIIYTKSEAIEARKLAYKKESDPLHMEFQYDGNANKEQEWRDKVAEIKARYPLP